MCRKVHVMTYQHNKCIKCIKSQLTFDKSSRAMTFIDDAREAVHTADLDNPASTVCQASAGLY